MWLLKERSPHHRPRSPTYTCAGMNWAWIGLVASCRTFDQGLVYLTFLRLSSIGASISTNRDGYNSVATPSNPPPNARIERQKSLILLRNGLKAWVSHILVSRLKQHLHQGGSVRHPVLLSEFQRSHIFFKRGQGFAPNPQMLETTRQKALRTSGWHSHTDLGRTSSMADGRGLGLKECRGPPGILLLVC